MTEPERKKPGHGGARQGAGRRKKVLSPTALDETDVKLLTAEVEPDFIETLAQRHARLAVAAFVKALVAGANEAARVSAANAILDRGYGKPAVDIGGEPGQNSLFGPPPVTVGGEVRSEARKYANLAIEVLSRIAQFGRSESARVSAAKSLLDRGLGTVATAKLPDEFNPRPLGKREAAARAAEVASSGRYATPPAPGETPQDGQ